MIVGSSYHNVLTWNAKDKDHHTIVRYIYVHYLYITVVKYRDSHYTGRDIGVVITSNIFCGVQKFEYYRMGITCTCIYNISNRCN